MGFYKKDSKLIGATAKSNRDHFTTEAMLDQLPLAIINVRSATEAA
jgi:hypothetical protein